MPRQYFDSDIRKITEVKATGVVDRAPRDGDRLTAFVEGVADASDSNQQEGALQVVSVIVNQAEVSEVFSDFWFWFVQRTPTMYLSVLLCIVAMVSMGSDDGDSSMSGDSSYRSLSVDAYRRWYIHGHLSQWFNPMGHDIPVGFIVFFVVGALHLTVTVGSLVAFVKIRESFSCCCCCLLVLLLFVVATAAVDLLADVQIFVHCTDF